MDCSSIIDVVVFGRYRPSLNIFIVSKYQTCNLTIKWTNWDEALHYPCITIALAKASVSHRVLNSHDYTRFMTKHVGITLLPSPPLPLFLVTHHRTGTARTKIGLLSPWKTHSALYINIGFKTVQPNCVLYTPHTLTKGWHADVYCRCQVNTSCLIIFLLDNHVHYSSFSVLN